MSLPARGGWIEISLAYHWTQEETSLPARGGWIEIEKRLGTQPKKTVPPRTGRVD